MIPKIIHYCWFGGNPLPEDAKKCIESWKKFLPDYEIKEWNESNFDVNILVRLIDLRSMLSFLIMRVFGCSINLEEFTLIPMLR